MSQTGTAGDHKGPPHAAPPPSPLRAVDGLVVRLMRRGPIYRARGVGQGQRTAFANSIMFCPKGQTFLALLPDGLEEWCVYTH